jgi:enoyl-CoA hydratase
MDFDTYRNIKLERTGRIITAAFNRPDHLNAVSGEMHAEIGRLFVDLRDDPDSDVIILTGEGKAFSAGGDFALLLHQNANPHILHSVVREAKEAIFGLLECHKPIIGRINGDAIGLGATLALLCDVIIAADTARFGDPHVKVGLTAGDGGAMIWPQLIGFARAKQYLFSGDLIKAPEAAAMGLINFAVPAEELDAKVQEWAERLAATAPLALQSTKTLVNMELKRIAHAMMDAGMAFEAMTMTSEDLREAIAAIKEKRTPVFTGR